MNKHISDFIYELPQWLKEHEDHQSIIFGSCLTLSRNMEGFPFSHKASDDQRERILDKFLHSCLSEKFNFIELSTLSDLEKQLLLERHTVSEKALLSKSSGAFISKDESHSLLINEEDHLRMQYFSPGLQLTDAWKKLNKLDDEISQNIPWAYSNDWGYYTCSPASTGTGLKVFVMLNLAALEITQQLKPLMNACNKMGFLLKGWSQEGTDAAGLNFILSSNHSLGLNESQLIDKATELANEIVKKEQNARTYLLNQEPEKLLQLFTSSHMALKSSYSLNQTEATTLLTFMRVGALEGFFERYSSYDISRLIISTQNAHFQEIFSDGYPIPEELTQLSSKDYQMPKDLDIFRTAYLKNRFA